MACICGCRRTTTELSLVTFRGGDRRRGLPEVVTPKVLGPPPRKAQNRSAFVFSVAVTN